MGVFMKRSRVRNPRWRTKAYKNILHSYSRQGTRAAGKSYGCCHHNLKALDDDARVSLIDSVHIALTSWSDSDCD